MTIMREFMQTDVYTGKKEKCLVPWAIGIVVVLMVSYAPGAWGEERAVGNTVLASPFGWESTGVVQQRIDEMKHFTIDNFVTRDDDGRVWVVAPVAGEISVAKNRVVLTGAEVRVVFPRALHRSTDMVRVDAGDVTDIQIDGDVLGWVLLLLPDGVVGLDHDDYGYRIRHEVRGVMDIHAMADGYVSTAPEPLSTESWNFMTQAFVGFLVNYVGLSRSFIQGANVQVGQTIGWVASSSIDQSEIHFSTVEDPQPRLGFIQLQSLAD